MTTYTWTGASSNDWNDPTNWDSSIVPTSVIDVVFNNSNNCQLSGSEQCRNFTFANATPVIQLSNAAPSNIFGNLTLFAGAIFLNAGGGTVVFSSTSTGKTITTAGLNIGITQFDGVGGGWTLQDTFNISTASMTLTNGALSTGNQAVTVGSLISSNANVRSLTLGSSTVSLTATSGTVWNFATATNLTFTAGTSTIKLTGSGSGSKTFAGGTQNYNNFWNATTGSGVLIVTGSNTFNNFKVDAGRTVQFTAGTTTTVTSLTINGTQGNRTVIQSTGSTYTLTVNGAYRNLHYVTISNCNATATPLTAYNSIDGGGNSGITFIANNTSNAWGSNPVSSLLDCSDGNIVITPNGQYIDLKLSTTLTGLTSIVVGSVTIQSTGISAANGFSLSISGSGAGILNIINGNDVGRIRLFNNIGTFYSGFRAGGLSASTEWILPTADSTGTQAFVSNGSGTMSFQTIPTASSGTYTPTLTNTLNLTASTAYVCQYMRVGTVVTVSGRIDVTPTTLTANTQLDISLPISSNFTLGNQCGGAGNAPINVVTATGILARPSATTALMQWQATTTTNTEITFIFTYQIL